MRKIFSAPCVQQRRPRRGFWQCTLNMCMKSSGPSNVRFVKQVSLPVEISAGMLTVFTCNWRLFSAHFVNNYMVVLTLWNVTSKLFMKNQGHLSAKFVQKLSSLAAIEGPMLEEFITTTECMSVRSVKRDSILISCWLYMSMVLTKNPSFDAKIVTNYLLKKATLKNTSEKFMKMLTPPKKFTIRIVITRWNENSLPNWLKS